MFRHAILCAALLVASTQAHTGQLSLLGAGKGSASVAYVAGPGDVVSGAFAWYGLRAYSAAVAATGTQKSVNLRRNTDNATADVLILPTGAVDLASAIAHAGTYTATASVATTVLTVTAITGTPIVVGDTIEGTGITVGTIITAFGTGTGGTGTYTLNLSQTAASTTITATHGLFVATAYDQSGNSRDATQATAANQPQFLPSCSGMTGPCLQVTSAAQVLSTSSQTLTANAQSFSGVVNRSVGTGTTRTIFVNGNNLRFSTGVGVANLFKLQATGAVDMAATDAVWHTYSGVANAASSVITIDGSDTTGSFTTSAGSGTIDIMDGGTSTTLSATEVGVWDTIFFSSGNRTALHDQQHLYWGF